MRAQLETRCGCRRVVEVHFPPPRILEMALRSSSFNVGMPADEDAIPTVGIPSRRFILMRMESYGDLGVHRSTAYYEEE